MLEKLFEDVYSNEIKWSQDCEALDSWIELTHYIKDEDRVTVSTKHSYLVKKGLSILTVCPNGEALYSWQDFLFARNDKEDFQSLLIDGDLVTNNESQKFYLIDQVQKNPDNTFLAKEQELKELKSIFTTEGYLTQINFNYLKSFYGKHYDLGQSIYIDRKVSKNFKQLSKLKSVDMVNHFYRGEDFMIRLSIFENILTSGETLCRIEATKIIRL